MSLLPIIFANSLMDSARPSRHQFGVPNLEDLISPLTIPDFHMYLPPRGYYRPWRTSTASSDSGSTITFDKEKFQVNLDVQQFKPEEISVKVTGNNQITVEGKHEEQEDEHGFISRHFVRRYVVPGGHDVEKVVSQLSSDGILTIVAPKIGFLSEEQKEIPITKTGKSARENQEEKQN